MDLTNLVGLTSWSRHVPDGSKKKTREVPDVRIHVLPESMVNRYSHTDPEWSPKTHKSRLDLSSFCAQLTSQLPLDMPSQILPAVLPNTKSLGSNFLASYSLCLFISALETGVIVVCFSRFLTRRVFADSLTIKLLVCFVTFISL